jgi:hypothetical protein
MRRPKTLKAAKARAWSAISAYIRTESAVNGMAECVTCGKWACWKDLHCGHYQHGLTYGEMNGEFIVLEENLHPQCPGCNTYRGGMLDKYTLFMIDTYGREMVEELQELRHKPLKMRIDDYWGIEQQYKEKL